MGDTMEYPTPMGHKPSATRLFMTLATDGCRVELDGTCLHGHPSWKD